MTRRTPVTELDPRYSEITEAHPWPDTLDLLVRAELSWLSTVRPDGKPHVTPLPAVWHDGAPHFCTGPDERKARNIAGNPHCVLTTGMNTHWAGVDVVLEGTARRIVDDATLHELAAAWTAKYGEFWRYDVADGMFWQAGGVGAVVYRVEPVTAFAFTKGKGKFGQTRYRF
ncbi:MAG: pyridoxamine 5'-phosphate oxidase family protein [Actinophytocola sp.]|uniref:pyridoxamine 5'-phosphate oxidase family protein n=1 Tax=Actinophytocola sp. TaxID=1872138 RepID=UPI003D6B2F89